MRGHRCKYTLVWIIVIDRCQILTIDIDRIKVEIGMHDFFCTLAAELWPLIGVDFFAHLAFLQRGCSQIL